MSPRLTSPAGLGHVRWLGGGSGAGKSTTARRLAAENGWDLYVTDDFMADHARRCPAAEAPSLAAFAAMSMDERWVDRTPAEMLETFHWFRGEGFRCIVEDLLALDPGRTVLAEGFRLLPDLVAPLLGDPTHAVWLLPTPEFRRAAFTSRGGLWAVAGRTGDPPRALENLLARDALFTERLRERTAALGLRTLVVDGSLDEVATARLTALA